METVVLGPPGLKGFTNNNVLLRLYDYWLAKRGVRLFSSRRDLDVLEFSFAINWLSLVDVLDKPRRFRYRLVSTTLTDRLGYEMTGKYVDHIPEDEVRSYVKDLYTRAVDLRAPLYEKSTRTFDYKVWQHEVLVLPLSSDGTNIDMLMIYRITYDPKPL